MVQFTPQDADIVGCFDAKANPATSELHDAHFNFVAWRR
jgi:hypothetical protein